jgi:hypothetical protein
MPMHVGSAADEVLSVVADVYAGIVGIVAVACFLTFASVPDLAGVPRVVSSHLFYRRTDIFLISEY